jgi:hypothetical protein
MTLQALLTYPVCATADHEMQIPFVSGAGTFVSINQDAQAAGSRFRASCSSSGFQIILREPEEPCLFSAATVSAAPNFRMKAHCRACLM